MLKYDFSCIFGSYVIRLDYQCFASMKRRLQIYHIAIAPDRFRVSQFADLISGRGCDPSFSLFVAATKKHNVNLATVVLGGVDFATTTE